MPFRLRWTGSADATNIATAGNWLDVDLGTTAGAAPVTGDSAEVIDTAHNLTGTLTGADLTSWYFGPNFQGTLDITISASSGSDAMVIYASNCSSARLTAGTTGFDKLKAKGGNLTLVSGTTVILEGASGAVSVAAAAVVTTCYAAGAAITFGYNSTAITTLIIESGTVSSARTITTATTAGAGTLLTTTLAAALTTCHVHNGSRINHQSSGTIGTANVYTGGRLDEWNTPYPSFTVTNANVWVGATYFPNPTANITATNPPVPIGTNNNPA